MALNQLSNIEAVPGRLDEENIPVPQLEWL